MYDLKITGGILHDGSGAPGRVADIAIQDGRIAAIGMDLGAAERTIDASGKIVTPGFIDIHTHYDGQASWDDELRPSIDHGVTTAIMGNCGVGFAPVRDTDHDKLIKLMEGVEDIPGTALHEGLTWDWESFPDYLDALAKIPRTIDIAAMLPHDPLRMYVMGDRAVFSEPANDDDIAEMRRLTREALEAGAIGFAALRGGSVVGDHEVILAGENEQIRLAHRAEDRDIFARGALKAALWAQDQSEGLYSMQQVLGL